MFTAGNNRAQDRLLKFYINKQSMEYIRDFYI